MQTSSDTERVAATILALERAAIDRWNKGDVEGCLEVYAPDVTYFDPLTATRIDGWPAVAAYFRTIWAGKVRIPRYDIVNARVVTDGHVAALSYNLVNYAQGPDGSETLGMPWNATQIYRRTGDRWQVAHVHWSFTKHPAFAAMSPESAEAPQM
jgi:uncharacterized protein (TIGR02246 family)